MFYWKIHHTWYSYQTTSWTRVAYFHILTSEYIDDVISRSFTVVCANSRWKMASDRFVYIIKRKLHGVLKIWNVFSRVKNNIFLPLENKIHIFAPPCNILYVFYSHISISCRKVYSKSVCWNDLVAEENGVTFHVNNIIIVWFKGC